MTAGRGTDIDGYSFSVTIPSGSTGIRDYTAHWTANTYTVHYNGNGGAGAMADSCFTYDESGNLRGNSFTKTGYVFAGWATSATGAVAYADGQSVLNVTQDNGGSVTLYAIWNVSTYTVAYNAVSGTGTMANSGFTYDVSGNLRSNSFTRTGYVFAGWAASADGAAVYADGQSVINLTAEGGVVNLYAIWTISVVPSYINLADYSPGDTITVNPGKSAVITGSQNGIQIVCGEGTTVTLAGVTIDNSSYDGTCPLSFTGSGNTLNIAEGTVNTLTGGLNAAGVFAGTGTTLTIEGTGTLKAAGGSTAAGIGGGSGFGGTTPNGGTVIITGNVTVNASSYLGAGIGGGTVGWAGDIVIYSGTINASSTYGTGIGAGALAPQPTFVYTSGNFGYYVSDSGSVAIKGGTISATGGTGIGGTGDAGVNVTISGGDVTATGYIGITTNWDIEVDAGLFKVVISGGTVTATGTGGAGIGATQNGDYIAISGGFITATGGTTDSGGSAGIGGSIGCHAGYIDITGGVVMAAGGDGAEDIGAGTGAQTQFGLATPTVWIANSSTVFLQNDSCSEWLQTSLWHLTFEAGTTSVSGYAIPQAWTTAFGAYLNIACTLTFDSQGGSDVPLVYILASGDGKADAPNEPLRLGYTFSGWYEAVACDTAAVVFPLYRKGGYDAVRQVDAAYLYGAI